MTMTVKHFETKSCEGGRQEKRRLFDFGKSEFTNDMAAVSKYLKGCHVKEEANIFCTPSNGRAGPSQW